MASIAIVTDSAAAVPEPLARRWSVTSVPLDIIVDGVPHPDSSTLGAEDVMRAFDEGRSVTTSQPSVGTFVEQYRQLAEAGATEILSFHVTSQISGTVNAARVAAEQSPVPTRVVDTRTMGMATGFAAVTAAFVVKEGGGAAEAIAEANRVAETSAVFVTVATLEYLRRGGRVPATMASLGNALHIRPILTIKDGALVVLQRIRTTPRARQTMVDLTEERIGAMSHPALSIMGLRMGSYPDDIARNIEGKHPDLAMLVRTPVSAVLAVHGGPGAFSTVIVDLPKGLR